MDEETRQQLDDIRSSKVKAGELTEEEAQVKLEVLGINPPRYHGHDREPIDDETRQKLVYEDPILLFRKSNE